MGEHTEPITGRPRPVLILDAVKAVLAVAVALGWIVLPDATLNLVITAVGALLSLGASFWTQHLVTPISDPVAADGQLLIPGGEVLAREGLGDG